MKRYTGIMLILLAGLITSCGQKPEHSTRVDSYPEIYPDYINVTIPSNIAPLNFKLTDNPTAIEVKISGKNSAIRLRSRYKIKIPYGKWKDLLNSCTGDSVRVSVSEYSGGKWFTFRPFSWYVSADPIDPWLSYRLIEPGYEVWNRLSIYQRDLTSFEEKELVDNNLTGNGCINCHTFSMQDPELSFFHLRGKNGGTIIQEKGMLRKLDTSSDSTISAGVYGSFHPSGRYIAFSTNVIIPEFHSVRNLRLEVYDTISDLILLDIRKNEIIKPKVVASKNAFETFPVFSSDGTKLYFCSARAVRMPMDYKSAKYSLCSVDFDASSRTFGTIVDTLVSACRTGKSVSQPKTSPDGRYIMYTSFDYGNFPIWHMEADLLLRDLKTGITDSLKSVNSGRSDTYHSWSSDSRWFVFASKRDDGMYGKPYFAHIDENGKASKAFLLPQKDPDFYDFCLKSFNIPELSKGPAPFNPREIGRIVKDAQAEKVKFESK